MSATATPQVREFVLKGSPPGGNSHDYFITKKTYKMEQTG